MAHKPTDQPKSKSKASGVLKMLGFFVLLILVIGTTTISLPYILTVAVRQEESAAFSAMSQQFPVTVNPKNKTIVENDTVNNFLESANSPLQAAVGNAVWNTFEWLATTIANTSWYQDLASVNTRFIIIAPGMRKEQVASAFAGALAWNLKEEKQFLTPNNGSTLPLSEGSFSPGTYLVDVGTTPSAAQTIINNRFSKDVLSHYGTSTAEIVPLNETLTIASLIQRETGGNDDMRLISGIIWNRIFANMDLQIDATLQYVKADNVKTDNWWPAVVPNDKYRKSPYNTYLHPGLPPTPISNPSVAAILAALNPIKTSCLFYFHDQEGTLHCSDTYAEHVALLKKYYGQGK